MSTTYRLALPPSDHCAHCGRSEPGRSIPIGISAAGWCFGLYVMPSAGVHDLDDWRPLLAAADAGDALIVDDYGNHLSSAQMIAMIDWRGSVARTWSAWGETYERRFHELNRSERGPGGLLRRRVGGNVIRHGAGAWDCLVEVIATTHAQGSP